MLVCVLAVFGMAMWEVFDGPLGLVVIAPAAVFAFMIAAIDCS